MEQFDDILRSAHEYENEGVNNRDSKNALRFRPSELAKEKPEDKGLAG